MTWGAADVEQVMRLLRAGVSQAEVARRTGVPRGTVRTWISRDPEAVLAAKRRSDCIKGRYAHPRYSFSNRSDDIRQIFINACRRAGVVAKPNGRWQVSVSRRDDVALMDTFVGPKR